jgi:hypothetical protein
MLFTNLQTRDCQHVDMTTACCLRAIVQLLLRIGYVPFDPRAVAYVRRLNLHVVTEGADHA